MTSLLYRLLTWSFWVLGIFLLPFLGFGNFRHHLWMKDRLRPKPLSRQPLLWMHAVSVGEIKIALALYRALPEDRRQRVLFTTTTPSGMAFLQQNLPHEAMGQLLPWDVSWTYQRLFHRLEVPDLLLVETEIWPELFAFVNKSGASLGIVNARLSRKTLRLKKLGILRRAIARLNWVAARSDADARRFVLCGLPEEKARVTGNIKFDFEAAQLSGGTLKEWLSSKAPTIVFASMASDEAPLLAGEIAKLLAWNEYLRILWAPRQIAEVDRHLQALAHSDPQKRTLLDGNPRLLVLDTLGELSGCYAFADLSFVGGSFNTRGGQNFLESLQVGTPALVGPSTENFRGEVREAKAAGAILEVETPEEVAEGLISLMEHPDRRSTMAMAGKSFLAKHVGAVARTVQVLLDSKAVAKPKSEEV